MLKSLITPSGCSRASSLWRSSKASVQFLRHHSTASVSGASSHVSTTPDIFLMTDPPRIPATQPTINTSKLSHLSALLEQFTIHHHSPLNSSLSKVEYKLPTLSYNNIHKRTILDPITNPQTYKLPTSTSIVKEIVTPASEHAITPIEDPSPIQRAINEGAAPVTMETMPYLMRVRKKMMKKHKLRKLRKRMIFVNRKLTAAKNNKKETLLKKQEKQYMKWAEEFDAQAYVEEQVAKGKKGGWKIDIFETRKMDKLSANKT